MVVSVPKIAFCIAVLSMVFAVSLGLDFDSRPELLLDKSAPHIGADRIQSMGYSGKGVAVAVIDTGIDFAHPDLHGFSEDGKVIGGHNFVSESEPPGDRNGHGTQVAGIIAANGNVTGIAPDSKILSYKVSDDGESVSSELIARAIHRAIEDGADIINISLGVNKTNSRIDSAVNEAVERGVVVVVAAGNDGPMPGTIGSPGRNPNAITVGATYNNITSSLVSTLEVDGRQYQIIPMLGVSAIQEPITGEVIFGNYGRDYDYDAIDVAGSIVLAERGSGGGDEVVYFAEKEFNAANAGARAVVVYNNEPGLYLGDVSESVTIGGYAPRIPIVSLSQKDGMEIREALGGGARGTLNVFYNPDYVAFFSSRGPASPFFVKPDLVAPGAFINSTDVGGIYNFSSGTSFAAPHVSGSAALLLEKHPGLGPGQLKSLLATTAVPVTDAYGNGFPTADAGAGRLSLENAFNAEIIVEPAFLIMVFSPAEREQAASLSLGRIGGGQVGDISVDIESPEFIETEYAFDGHVLEVRGAISDAGFGDFEGGVGIRHNDAEYRIPIVFKHTQGSVTPDETQGLISFEIVEPEGWRYAKISVINEETGESSTTSLTPRRDSTITIPEPGRYWIESSISVDGQTQYAYDTIHVRAVQAGPGISSALDVPEGPVYIVAVIASMVAAAGMGFRVSGRRSP